MRSKIIVALDILDKNKCFEMIDLLSDEIDIFKIGLAPYLSFGEEILAVLEQKNKKVFLDLKFHDIPNTVKNAASIATRKNVFMMNFHCLGGAEMLSQAKEAVNEAVSAGCQKPILLGVTILTSMNRDALKSIGMTDDMEEAVANLAILAKKNGMDGVVASAQETKMIKELCGKDFIVVTPGIRPLWSAKGDQSRIVTPKQAFQDGSDYIVIGRPIIAADDPREATKKILEEIDE
ncbi:MAG: orotidine-5'-phosphate decarboxylase [Candidatus Omnitrophica bacterium]|nr:orotidine-5'-phosphate decarboxylase [Candidatus Omnitrophota bacterium]